MANNKYHRIIAHNQARHTVIAELVKENVELHDEWPAIIFVREVAHGRELAGVIEALLSRPVPLVTSKAQWREELQDRMRERDPGAPVAVATDTWATGIDIPCLAAAYQTGGGSAPIGLRQRAGRPLRRDGDKVFKFYDIVDIIDDPRTMEHNTRRLGHYERAGFKVSDAELLKQILTPMPKNGQRPRKQPERGQWGRAPYQEDPLDSWWGIFLTIMVTCGPPALGLMLLLYGVHFLKACLEG